MYLSGMPNRHGYLYTTNKGIWFLSTLRKLLKIAKYCSRFGTVTVFAHKGMVRKKMAASKYKKRTSKNEFENSNWRAGGRLTVEQMVLLLGFF